MTQELAIRDAVAADRMAIAALLTAAALPLDGVDDAVFVVAESDGTIIGCAAIEPHGSAALLRSVAVDASWRGTGVGHAMVTKVIASADNEGIDPVALLTATAPDWFTRFGFTRVTRDAVPASLLASAEFQGACPSSATIMLRTVAGIPQRG